MTIVIVFMLFVGLEISLYLLLLVFIIVAISSKMILAIEIKKKTINTSRLSIYIYSSISILRLVISSLYYNRIREKVVITVEREVEKVIITSFADLD